MLASQLYFLNAEPFRQVTTVLSLGVSDENPYSRILKCVREIGYYSVSHLARRIIAGAVELSEEDTSKCHC